MPEIERRPRAGNREAADEAGGAAYAHNHTGHALGRLSPSLRQPFPAGVRLINLGRVLYAAAAERYAVAVRAWFAEELDSGHYTGLGNPYAGDIYLLCRKGDPAPLGFAVVHGDDPRRVELIWVRQDQRRNGLGTAFLAALQNAYPSLALCPPVSTAARSVADRLGIHPLPLSVAEEADQAGPISRGPAVARWLVSRYGTAEAAAAAMQPVMADRSTIPAWAGAR